MYSVSSLKQGIDDPRRILQEFNRLYYRRLKTQPYNEEGLDVFERDWDTLCILDACKYDLFEERNTLPGNLEKVVSRSSSTKEFLRANFHGREFLDTVYVTGSPMLHRLRDRIDTQFHDVINVWQEEGWDETCRTVMPETMADATRKARAEYPNKRLFVHFLQPHYPFIGPIGREHFDLDRLNFEWDKLRRGEIDIPEDVVRQAYAENLDEVLPHIEQLFSDLPGRIVVTSDHGQMFGTSAFPIPLREYGHPPGIYTPELVEVPWLVYDQETRPEISAEDPTGPGETDVDQELAQERLRDLGYL
jgi:hypothetical protein